MLMLSNACKAVHARFTQMMMALPRSMSISDKVSAVKAAMGDIGKKKPSTADIAVAYQVNSILSGVKTAVANIASIPFQGVLTPINDVIETLIKRGQGKDVALADVLAGFRNIHENFKIATEMSYQGWLRGYPLDVEGSLDGIAYSMKLSKHEARNAVKHLILKQKAQAMSAQDPAGRSASDLFKEMEAKGIQATDKEVEAFINENFDYFRNVFTGPLEFISVPTKVTVGIDEFGKSMFRMYKVQQEAWRKARQDAKRPEDVSRLYEQYRSEILHNAMGKGKGTGSGHVGQQNLAAMRGNLGKLFGAGEDDLLPFENIREWSAAKMFQQPLTGLPRTAQEGLKAHPLMRIFVPFMKTPWNIMKEGMSYVPAVAPTTRMMFKPKLLDDGTVSNVQRGAYYELSREQMIARQFVGGTMLVGLWSMFDSDEITGTARNSQERQAWKDSGKPEQSIKIGDRWYGYGRIEPVATVVQLVAEMKRVTQELEDNPRDLTVASQFDEVMLGLKNAIMDKTFLEGFNDMIDSAREGKLEQVAATVARQAVPTLLSDIARSMDGKERQATTPLQAAQQRVPYLREMLPEEYGLYGPAREGSQMQIWTGITSSSEADLTPLQKAMQTLGINKVRPNDKLKRVGLTDQQLSEYRKVTAQMLTPRLEALANNPSFQALPKGRQKVLMEAAIDKYKPQAAKYYFAKLMQTSPEYAKDFYVEELIKKGYVERARSLANQ